jgi:hypothetical protein
MTITEKEMEKAITKIEAAGGNDASIQGAKIASRLCNNLAGLKDLTKTCIEGKDLFKKKKEFNFEISLDNEEAIINHLRSATDCLKQAAYQLQKSRDINVSALKMFDDAEEAFAAIKNEDVLVKVAFYECRVEADTYHKLLNKADVDGVSLAMS